MDVTGADAWTGVQSYLAANDADLSLTRVRPGSRERLERLGLLDGVRFFDTNRAAIAALSLEGAAHDRR